MNSICLGCHADIGVKKTNSCEKCRRIYRNKWREIFHSCLYTSNQFADWSFYETNQDLTSLCVKISKFVASGQICGLHESSPEVCRVNACNGCAFKDMVTKFRHIPKINVPKTIIHPEVVRCFYAMTDKVLAEVRRALAPEQPTSSILPPVSVYQASACSVDRAANISPKGKASLIPHPRHLPVNADKFSYNSNKVLMDYLKTTSDDIVASENVNKQEFEIISVVDGDSSESEERKRKLSGEVHNDHKQAKKSKRSSSITDVVCYIQGRKFGSLHR